MNERRVSEERIKGSTYGSVRDTFWTIFNNMDNLKEGRPWTSSGSRPTVTDFRYMVVPILWSDRASPSNPISDDEIKGVFSYIEDYYGKMSFGTFMMRYRIHDTVRVDQPSKNPDPSHGKMDRELHDLLAKEGYVHGIDFDGALDIYPVVTSGDFSWRGEIANIGTFGKLSLTPKRCASSMTHAA